MVSQRHFAQAAAVLDNRGARGAVDFQQLRVAVLRHHDGIRRRPNEFRPVGESRLLDEQGRIGGIFQPAPGLAELIVDLDLRLDRRLEGARAINQRARRRRPRQVADPHHRHEAECMVDGLCGILDGTAVFVPDRPGQVPDFPLIVPLSLKPPPLVFVG